MAKMKGEFDVDAVIEQLLSVRDTPGKQVGLSHDPQHIDRVSYGGLVCWGTFLKMVKMHFLVRLKANFLGEDSQTSH
jgi:hypothetical protein